MSAVSQRTARKAVPARRIPPGAENESVSWLGSDAVLFTAIVLFAFVVRLIYLFQIEAIPLFYHLPGDPRTYDAWAQRIAAGDGLGQGVFYQTPLYPVFLALLQVILGHDLWAIRVAQMFLGALSCGLVFQAGKSFFSRAAGVAAGLILSLYAPAIFYNGLIDKPVLDLLLLCLLLLLLSSALQRPHWIKWTAQGAVLALLGLSRENALVLAPVIALWIVLYFHTHPLEIRLGWLGLFAAGLMLILFPVGLRNLRVGGEFVLTTSQLGPNFFIGNNSMADGTYGSVRAAQGVAQFERRDATRLAEQATGRSLSPAEVSSYWLVRSWGYIRSQPLDWLRLMIRKWLVVWHVREIEDSDDFYIYQRWSSLLRALASINHFGLLAPLAAVGVVLTRRDGRRLWLLYVMVMMLALSVALFYVFGRYRFSLVPPLALFAGAALVAIFDLLKQGKLRPLAVAAAIGLAFAVAARSPVVDSTGLSAPGYNNLAVAFSEAGNAAEAIASLQQAVRLQPSYGVAHFNLANLYAKAGRLDEAADHQREAVRLYPRFAEARNNLGQIHAARGELESAAEELRRTLQVDPDLRDARFNLGLVLGKQGRLEEAMQHFRRVVGQGEAHYYLGRVVAAQGRLDEAAGHFRRALVVKPGLAEAHTSLAQVLAAQGEEQEATRHRQEALRIMQTAPAATLRRFGG